jgi:hypothetical protein
MSDVEISLLKRRARIGAAAVRAAFAWSIRDTQPVLSAEELARMTGVLMAECGPGMGPTTPMETVDVLRRPLGAVLPAMPAEHVVDARAADDAVLLNVDGTLSADVYLIDCGSMTTVLGDLVPGEPWPSWARTRAEDAEHETFAKLVANGDPAAYRAARCTLVENPAGTVEEIATAFNRADAPRVGEYVPLPVSKQFRSAGGVWWWPCPECKWPMSVDGVVVRCRYMYHSSVFQVLERPRSAPRLQRSNPSPRGGSTTVPQARSIEGVLQVDAPDWRYIVVPGSSEVRIAGILREKGALVEIYPHLDRFDLAISVGERRWDVDIKEHNTAEGLLRHLVEKPPSARLIVLPASHAPQKAVLEASLLSYTFLTEQELLNEVRSAVRRQQRRER